ncbi:MAG: DUF1963 domain-containing protein [Bradyrhizobium sp.]|nr:DUF1963 domain-containing protein [Bradyrhizobium sp.]
MDRRVAPRRGVPLSVTCRETDWISASPRRVSCHAACPPSKARRNPFANPPCASSIDFSRRPLTVCCYFGAVKALLLFQIATDDAMHWCFGDAGACYVFLGVDALKEMDFSKATMTLECY